ncbi:MAG TPA: hypothetical protein VLI54_02150 [Bacillota bacterium]|nr:hypothetical protein [Bacillota bacterium]
MIQFNLLPDIKIQYLKARRQKHLVMLASTIVTVVSVAVLVFLISIVFGLQKKNISDLSSDIKTDSAELKSTANLNRMLTVQNQLTSLAALHDAKPVTSRVYSFMTQVTPTNASISRMSADFSLHTMQISGVADTLSTVNSFVDALKYAKYHTAAAPSTEAPAFTSVVLSSFARDKTATFTITLNFDPTLFSESSDVTLSVPNITTRSNGGANQALFKKTDGQ